MDEWTSTDDFPVAQDEEPQDLGDEPVPGETDIGEPATQDSEDYDLTNPSDDLPEFVYSREWTDPGDFPGLSYTKNWESSDDFPTIETDEQTVREDMQALYDEVKSYVNGVFRAFIADAIANETVRTWSEYNDLRTYRIGDRVVSEGSSYICLRSCTGIQPPDDTYWLLIAAGGSGGSADVTELYADYGMIADLTVDRLRTDYMRAFRYLDHDTSPLDYLYIHDEEISFWTGKVVYSAVTGLPEEEQMSFWGRDFYWRTDPAVTPRAELQMTFTEETSWPVMSYVYDEDYGSGDGVRPKGSIHFEEESDGHGGTYKVPVFVLGQGTDPTKQTENGMAKIVKHTDGLEISYITEAGRKIGMWLGENGYNDLEGLRKVTALDFSALDSGEFTVTLEGNIEKTYLLDYDGSGNIIAITGEGLEVPVLW